MFYIASCSLIFAFLCFLVVIYLPFESGKRSCWFLSCVFSSSCNKVFVYGWKGGKWKWKVNIFLCAFLVQSHFKELILEHAPPPPAIAEFATANLIKMGFPQRAAEGSISICSCHKEAKVGAGYTCPRCKARVCELPTECRICGLTLVSSPHLARSYHHLFPIAPFDEVPPFSLNDPNHKLQRNCFGCQQSLLNPGKWW